MKKLLLVLTTLLIVLSTTACSKEPTSTKKGVWNIAGKEGMYEFMRPEDYYHVTVADPEDENKQYVMVFSTNDIGNYKHPDDCEQINATTIGVFQIAHTDKKMTKLYDLKEFHKENPAWYDGTLQLTEKQLSWLKFYTHRAGSGHKMEGHVSYEKLVYDLTDTLARANGDDTGYYKNGYTLYGKQVIALREYDCGEEGRFFNSYTYGPFKDLYMNVYDNKSDTAFKVELWDGSILDVLPPKETASFYISEDEQERPNGHRIIIPEIPADDMIFINEYGWSK